MFKLSHRTHDLIVVLISSFYEYLYVVLVFNVFIDVFCDPEESLMPYSIIIFLTYSSNL